MGELLFEYQHVRGMFYLFGCFFFFVAGSVGVSVLDFGCTGLSC